MQNEASLNALNQYLRKEEAVLDRRLNSPLLLEPLVGKDVFQARGDFGVGLSKMGELQETKLNTDIISL